MKKNYDLSILCYIGLVILFILLLLPPMLRLFGKNLYVKNEEKKKDTVIILTCDKQNENINSTFLNGNPQVFEYRIKGDYSVSVSDEKDTQYDVLGDENTEKENDTTQEENITDDIDIVSVIELIRPSAKIEYNANNDITSFKVKVTDLKEITNYNKIFSSIDTQQNYFINQGFVCQKTNYS